MWPIIGLAARPIMGFAAKQAAKQAAKKVKVPKPPEPPKPGLTAGQKLNLWGEKAYNATSAVSPTLTAGKYGEKAATSLFDRKLKSPIQRGVMKVLGTGKKARATARAVRNTAKFGVGMTAWGGGALLGEHLVAKPLIGLVNDSKEYTRQNADEIQQQSFDFTRNFGSPGTKPPRNGLLDYS